jgi:hypothetical protein
MLDDAIEYMLRMFGEGRNLLDSRFRRQRLQPTHLYLHPMPDQAKLTENGPQVDRFAAVAAVHGGNSGKSAQIHIVRSMLQVEKVLLYPAANNFGARRPVCDWL